METTLKSQSMRKLAPEWDPLRLGTGWKKEDLSKPQVMIESTFGDSHPGSGHLDKLVDAVRKGIRDAGGFGARYFCTDICDGESQGTDGWKPMNQSEFTYEQNATHEQNTTHEQNATCKQNFTHKQNKTKEDVGMTTKEISVEGMMCQHCVGHVKKALESVDGVAEATVE